MSKLLNDDDVVSITELHWSLIGAWTFKISQLMAHLKTLTNREGKQVKEWTEDGVPCEVLQPGGNWQKGKVRVRIEFIPDKPADEPSSIPGESDVILSLNSEQ